MAAGKGLTNDNQRDKIKEESTASRKDGSYGL